MKESTFTLIAGIFFVIASNLQDGVGILIFIAMSIPFLVASSICRAIEKNGREK